MSKPTQEVIDDMNQAAEQFKIACRDVLFPKMIEASKSLNRLRVAMGKEMKRQRIEYIGRRK